MLRLSHGVEDGARLVRRGAAAAVHVGDLEEVGLRCAADALHHGRRIAGEVISEMGEDAIRVVDAGRQLGDRDLRIDLSLLAGLGVCLRDANRFRLSLILPGLGVVGLLLRVEAGEDTVEFGGSFKVGAYQGQGVCVVPQVVLVIKLVLDCVVDEGAQENDVGARAQGSVSVGGGRRAREAGIDHDKLGAVVVPRLVDPAHRDGVVLRRVGANHKDDVGVLGVHPIVGHSTATASGADTGHRR